MLFNDFKGYLTVRKGAIHVGAHIGKERAWYKNMHFKKVIWFEPNKELFKELVIGIEPYHNQMACNIGIHDTLKKATLHIASNNGMSSSILELGTHKIYHPHIYYEKDQEIILTRMDDFFEENKFDIDEFNFLNIDVQGVELNVIKSFGSLIGNMDYIYMEINDEEVYKGCALVQDVDKYLKKYNFKRMITMMTKYHWGDALYLKL